MNIVVFEDAGTEKLFPITTGRPAYAISCGSYRLIDWLKRLDGPMVGIVRTYLETLQLADFPEFSTLSAESTWTLVVNARLAPSVSNFQKLQALVKRFESESESTEAEVFRCGWATAAAVVKTKTFDSLPEPSAQWLKTIDELGNQPDTKVTENGLDLFDYPHDVVMQNMDCIEESLAHRIEAGSLKKLRERVYVGKDVKLDSSVVFDTSKGFVVIDDNVKVGPFSFFRGPVYIGPNSKVSEHASIKDGVSVGHTCKVGGEVEGCVIEPYSNKQHHGFLGHSYLGSWINLGAGTCNSDLKNTYGIVNMNYGDEKVSTGTQFMGCIIGDYAKTAINTCIFTGKVVGTASMVYGFATTNVPSFTNYARTFGKMGVLPAAVTITTQKRMFKRRSVDQRGCDIQLVHDMFKLTENERPDDLSVEPISL